MLLLCYAIRNLPNLFLSIMRQMRLVTSSMFLVSFRPSCQNLWEAFGPSTCQEASAMLLCPLAMRSCRPSLCLNSHSPLPFLDNLSNSRPFSLHSITTPPIALNTLAGHNYSLPLVEHTLPQDELYLVLQQQLVEQELSRPFPSPRAYLSRLCSSSVSASPRPRSAPST